jgi:DNA-binding beta-propeller fold protein YncE
VSTVAGSKTASTSNLVRAVPLPGATGPASLDYIAYEPGKQGGRVWVPVGVTGSVDVLQVVDNTIRRIDGFKTSEWEVHDEKRVVGPSSVAILHDFAYIGNRATNEVCPISRETLVRGECLSIWTAIDGLAAIDPTHEVWATNPPAEALTVLEAAPTGRLKVSGIVHVPGKPEGYAVDAMHGLFFTNLEDKGKTVAIDVKTRTVKSVWANQCGKDGPRGVAVDGPRNLVMVACTDHIEVLDGAHDGAPLSTLATGAGVDAIDYAVATQRLYVAAGKAANLSVLHVGPRGELVVTARVETRDGARNAVVDTTGVAYLADSKEATLLVVSPPKE